MKQPAVYIMANRRNGTIYTGVTSDLPRRSHDHRTSRSGFTARYGCRILVYAEYHDDMNTAIAREKQIKAGSCKKKIQLIESINPEWKDLYDTIL